MKLKKLTLTAMMIALSAVLSMVKVYQLPLGGSITLLSMLPVASVALCYGTKSGLVASLLYACLQIALDLGALMGYGMTGIFVVTGVIIGVVYLLKLIPEKKNK